MEIKMLANTKRGSEAFIIQEPTLFRNLIKELSGNISITVKELDHEGTALQIWHFKNMVVPLAIRLAARSGTIFSELEAEALLMMEVCKLPGDKDLGDLDKKQMSFLIDTSKKWINANFGDHNGRKII